MNLEQNLTLFQPNVARASPGRPYQDAKLCRLETSDCSVVQHRRGDDARRRQDHLPKGYLPVANLRLGFLRGQANYGAKLSRAAPNCNQQAWSQLDTSAVEGKNDIYSREYFINTFQVQVH